MIGGGKGAFIGAIRRIAAQLDAEHELVCGAFSSNPEVSIESGKNLGLNISRCYASFSALFENEK